MFCCSKSSVAVSALVQPSVQPNYEDTCAILWLGSDKPDLSQFSPHTTIPGTLSKFRSAIIYHVNSLGEFKSALLGQIFKTKMSSGKFEVVNPRRFHAVIIIDWTSTIEKVELALGDIIRRYSSLEWSSSCYMVKEEICSSIGEDVREYLILNSISNRLKTQLAASFTIASVTARSSTDLLTSSGVVSGMLTDPVAWVDLGSDSEPSLPSTQMGSSSVTNPTSAVSTLNLTDYAGFFDLGFN
jgi:hypothetical protein